MSGSTKTFLTSSMLPAGKAACNTSHCTKANASLQCAQVQQTRLKGCTTGHTLLLRPAKACKSHCVCTGPCRVLHCFVVKGSRCTARPPQQQQTTTPRWSQRSWSSPLHCQTCAYPSGKHQHVNLRHFPWNALKLLFLEQCLMPLLNAQIQFCYSTMNAYAGTVMGQSPHPGHTL